jgi:serine/threonine-protein kinase
MAEVFLARQLGMMNFEKIVVVKTIHPHLSRQHEFISMLLDEARLSALIKNPNVVDIYDLGQEGDTYFIAMEYLAGQALSAVLTQARKLRKVLDVYGTIRIIADAASGLHAAHTMTSLSGDPMELVHRDVSPGNIVVLYDGRVKLVDFGVSKAQGRLSVTAPLQIKGKLGYIAPEQLRADPVDRRSDIYALGVVMWEALTWRRLFKPDTEADTLDGLRTGTVRAPSTERRDVPMSVDAICLRALADDPDDRYQSAEDMQHAIEDALREVGYYRDRRGLGEYMRQLFPDAVAEQQAAYRSATIGPGADDHEVEVLEVDLDPEDYAVLAKGTPGSGDSE